MFYNEEHVQAGLSLPTFNIQLLFLPGVIDRVSFFEQCNGCLDCADACPHNSITFTKTSTDKKYPFIDANESPCHLCADMPCSFACKTDALAPVPAEKVKMGKAMLDPMLCLCVTGEHCRLCVDACPLSGKAMMWDEEVSAPLINLNSCVGCGMCKSVCPAEENPIMIVPA